MNIINNLIIITTILFLSTKSIALSSKLINDCNIYKNQTIYFNTAKVLAYSNNYNQLIKNIVLDEQSCIITIDFKTIDLYYSNFNRDYYHFNDKRINISEYMTIVGGQNTKSVYGYIYSYISIISSNKTTLNNYMFYSSNNDVESTTSSSSNISLNFNIFCYSLLVSFILSYLF